MKDPVPATAHQPGRYEIRLQGQLDPRWATRFDGMSLTAHDDGTTVIEGPVADQAALHGLLRTLRDLGLPLVSLTQAETEEPEAHQAPGTATRPTQGSTNPGQHVRRRLT